MSLGIPEAVALPCDYKDIPYLIGDEELKTMTMKNVYSTIGRTI
jgi:hypothetical protein